MPKKVVLVTGIGGDIGQSIIKCLNETDYEFELLGCDIDPYAAGRNHVRKFFVVPPAVKEKKYYGFIEKTINEYKIKYIYPSTEQEIIFFDKHKKHFDKNDVTIFINNSFAIDTFFDKYKTIQFLKKNKLPYPVTFLIEEYDNQLNFPLIVKPRRGYGSKGVIKINNKEELNFYRGKMHDSIIQEYIGEEDEEYTTGVFYDTEHVYSITFKRRLGFGGVSKIAELVIDKKIDELAEKITRYSKAVVINIQTRKTLKGFIALEINPRFSSTVYLRHYFGFQDAKWWLDLKESKKIDFKLKYKNGIAVRTLSEEFLEIV